MKEFNVDGRIGKENSGVLELWTEENAGIPQYYFRRSSLSNGVLLF